MIYQINYQNWCTSTIYCTDSYQNRLDRIQAIVQIKRKQTKFPFLPGKPGRSCCIHYNGSSKCCGSTQCWRKGCRWSIRRRQVCCWHPKRESIHNMLRSRYREQESKGEFHGYTFWWSLSIIMSRGMILLLLFSTSRAVASLLLKFSWRWLTWRLFLVSIFGRFLF